MNDLKKKYPNISNWIADGEISIGGVEYNDTTARIIDCGGVAWETTEHYESLEDTLDAIEKGIASFCKKHGIEWEDSE